MQRRHLLGLAAGLALPALAPRAGLAQAKAWPQAGSIRLIAQFPPGGLVDTVSRLIAPALAQQLGQTVVVENRAGAGGVIGTDFAAKAAPDGYTLLVSHASVHIFSAATLPTLPFDPVADFTHMGMLVEAPTILLVKANSPYQTLDAYVAAARKTPVRYGSSGIGSAPHLLGVMLAVAGKAPELDHVPYKGSAPAMQDLMAGAIESLIDPVTTNVGLLQDGTLRALAVSSPKRLPQLPDVPTFAEQGYPELLQTQWLGLSAPKGLPQPIVEKLTAMIPGLLETPTLKARCEELATLPRNPPLLGADFVKAIKAELALWSGIAKQYNIVQS
jgi:tripartite-type tricarboxylate transporter receptor subunit TctC